MARKYNKMYMQVTQDKYALPIAYGDTVKELAEQIGAKPMAIMSYLSRYKRGDFGDYLPKYIRIEVE